MGFTCQRSSKAPFLYLAGKIVNNGCGFRVEKLSFGGRVAVSQNSELDSSGATIGTSNFTIERASYFLNYPFDGAQCSVSAILPICR